ncbi:MAG: DUF2934 domain-containing protein [Candidatus Omnitrophica bacterium]|nr:DUF2934 domain-containing protein [Candidatus Omnitrophota bacterium]
MARPKAATKQTNQAPAQGQDLQQQVAQKAYELWEQNGRVEGQDLENWLEAEHLIRQTRSSQG